MKRRQATIALLALAVLPPAAKAQPAGRPYRIGFLGLSNPADYAPTLEAFLQGLRALGYEDGRDVVIEYRWADGREERLPGLAAQLVQRNPDVLVAHATGVDAAQKATKTIPIVMGVSADPVAMGLIKSLAYPGGNTTGVASQLSDLAPKRLELLKEVVPKLSEVAILANLAHPAVRQSREKMETAARRLGVRLRLFGIVAEPAALPSVLDTILRHRPNGLIVEPDPTTGKLGVPIATFATKNRLPTIGGQRNFALDGGLLSYGGSFVEGWRLAARYVDKILKGAKPADLPVEQPTTFELVVNLNTAKALGITLPPAVTLRASEVIQ